MEGKNIYEVKINKNTYDVISADTAFYAFIGGRIYNTLSGLMEEQDAKKLSWYIAEGKDVILTLLDENGQPKTCLATFTNIDDTITEIKFLVLDDVRAWERQVRNMISMKNGILGLYGDYFFEYDVEADHFRIYAADRFEQNVLNLSFTEFKEMLRKQADENNAEDIEKLITALETGTRRFVVNIAGNVFNIKDTAFTLLKGVACYEEDRYVYATGYIHFWNERSTESAETQRAMERDYLTGVLTKAEITNLVINTVDVKKTCNVTLAIIDIDYFKKVNDVYGHMMGDEVLKKVASIIENEVREDGLVGRFGGDEFLVLFYNAYDMENMRERLRSIKNRVASSCVKTESGEDISITLSIGCAAFPKDADNYEDLFFFADFALYRAKEKGRNRYIIYDREKHGTKDDIQNTKMSVNTLNSRGNMSPAEIVCAMMDKVYTGQEYPLDKLLDDVALNMNIQRVTLYAGHPRKLVGMAGANRLTPEVVDVTRDYMDSPALMKLYQEPDIVAVDNVVRFENTSPTLYAQLKQQEIMALVHVRFKDKNGVDAILSLEYVKTKMAWNHSHFPYYRLLARLLSEYELL